MKYEELKEGMKVIDTEDGMVMEYKYKPEEKRDVFCAKGMEWGVCQFDLSTFQEYKEDEDK